MSSRILVTAEHPGSAINDLRSKGYNVRVVSSPGPVPREKLLLEIEEAEGLLCLLSDRIDRELLLRAKKLKAVSICAVGHDNVDLHICRERGIPVTNTPGVLTEATADLTLGLMLSLTRRFSEAEAYLRSGKFVGWKPDLFLGVDLKGKQLGIFGFGRIGQAVAERAHSFGMKIVATSRSPFEHSFVRAVSFDELLATSDIVTFHAPLTPETNKLMTRERLRKMKRGAYLINTARGAMVDEEALADLLMEGHIAGAGLDVFDQEPRIHPKLLKAPNTILLPHIGSATIETRSRMSKLAADQLDALLRGERQGLHLLG